MRYCTSVPVQDPPQQDVSQSSAKTAETRHSNGDELHFWIWSAVREDGWLPVEMESDESNGSFWDGDRMLEG